MSGKQRSGSFVPFLFGPDWSGEDLVFYKWSPLPSLGFLPSKRQQFERRFLHRTGNRSPEDPDLWGPGPLTITSLPESVSRRPDSSRRRVVTQDPSEGRRKTRAPEVVTSLRYWDSKTPRLRPTKVQRGVPDPVLDVVRSEQFRPGEKGPRHRDRRTWRTRDSLGVFRVTMVVEDGVVRRTEDTWTRTKQSLYAAKLHDEFECL